MWYGRMTLRWNSPAQWTKINLSCRQISPRPRVKMSIRKNSRPPKRISRSSLSKTCKPQLIYNSNKPKPSLLSAFPPPATSNKTKTLRNVMSNIASTCRNVSAQTTISPGLYRHSTTNIRRSLKLLIGPVTMMRAPLHQNGISKM